MESNNINMQGNNINEEVANAMLGLINSMFRPIRSNTLFHDMNMLPFPESNNNAFGNSIGLNNILQRSIEDAKPVYKNVISDDGKAKLENLIYSSDLNLSNLSCNICPITQDEFKDGDEIIKLPCDHYFNKKSILEWLENSKAECPVCRYKLLSKEIKIEENLENSIFDISNANAETNANEDADAIVEEENDLSQNLIYTQILRTFVVPPPDAFINNNITRNYLSQNIQYMHNNQDDLELQTILFQSLYDSQDVSGN